MNAVPLPILPTTLALTRDTVGFWNALVSRAGEPIALPGKGEAVFTLAEAPAPTATGVVATTTGGLAALAHVEDYPFKARFGIDLAPEDVEALPEGLRRAIVEGALQTVWSALPDLGFGALRIGAVGPLGQLSMPAGAAEPTWLHVVVANGAERVAVRLGVDANALATRLGASAVAARRIWPALKARLPVRALHGLGRIDMPAAEAAALEPGDLVVMPELPESRALIEAEGLGFVMNRAGDGWQIVAVEPSTRPHGGSTLSETPALERLTVTLQFDIGEATLPLADLETWQVGAVVPLAVPARDDGVQVTVRANGTVVGIGDLVRVDDRIAVRLTRLHMAP